MQIPHDVPAATCTHPDAQSSSWHLAARILRLFIISGMKPRPFLQRSRQEINYPTGPASLSFDSFAVTTCSTATRSRRWLGAISHSWQQDPQVKTWTIFFSIGSLCNYHIQIHIKPYIKTEKKNNNQGLIFSKTALSEWTELSVPTLARSDGRKIHLFNYSLSREQYILILKL